MIFKTFTLAVLICVGISKEIYGASYSNVYLQSGANGYYPVNYAYGAPGAPVTGIQVARLQAPPVNSVVPLEQVSNFVPCVTPCIIPTQAVDAVGNARLVTYKSPKVPVVVAKDEPTSYEYSYVVYDENTGDQKAQRELSDGVVVRGQYSLIQPDGFVREVQYTADDATGFNAIVKNFLPEEADKEKKETPPCNDVKSEALVDQPKSEKSEETLQTDDKPKVEGEANSAEEPSLEEKPKISEESKPEEAANSGEAVKSEEEGKSEEKSPESGEAKSEEKPEESKSEENSGSGIEGKKETPPESSGDISSEEKKTEEPTHEALTDSNPPDTNAPQVGYYSDILKCVQDAIKNNPEKIGLSPLTYILLPTKPC